MIPKTDFKSLLQRHAVDLFALHDNLMSLQFNPAYYPLIRYRRDLYPDGEMYWCENETPPAPLEIVWATPYGAPSLQPPQEIQARAFALLQELDNQRELMAIYRCGHFEGDTFVLSCWLIPFPADYEVGKGDGSGVFYTVTRQGVLGLAHPYTGNKQLYAELV